MKHLSIGRKKMVESKAELKKLVVEFRYKPTLRFYARMDQIGIDLEESFPNWARNPLSLEIRNKLTHRRLRIEHARSFFDCDAPQNVKSELSIVRDAIKSVCERLPVSHFVRFGMRSRFVVEGDQGFKRLVARVHRKFCTPVQEIPAFRGMQLSDTSFVITLTHNDWTYNVSLGPMRREQWFQVVPHEREIFEQEVGGASFEAFRNEIPEHFTFVDIDANRENVSRDDALHAYRANFQRSEQIAEGLIEYLRSE